MAADEAVHLLLRRDPRPPCLMPRQPCRVRPQPLRREWRHRRPHREWLRRRHGWLPHHHGRLRRIWLRHNGRIWLRHRLAWPHHAVRHPTSRRRNATWPAPMAADHAPLGKPHRIAQRRKLPENGEGPMLEERKVRGRLMCHGTAAPVQPAS